MTFDNQDQFTFNCNGCSPTKMLCILLRIYAITGMLIKVQFHHQQPLLLDKYDPDEVFQ